MLSQANQSFDSGGQCFLLCNHRPFGAIDHIRVLGIGLQLQWLAMEAYAGGCIKNCLHSFEKISPH